MKTKDIAKQYGIDQFDFETYLVDIGAGNNGIFGITLDDNIPEYVEKYKTHRIEAAKAIENAAIEKYNEAIRRQKDDQMKRQALAGVLISSGFSFEGYKIVKYSGYISGDDAVQIPRTGYFGKSNTGEELTKALVKIRRQAIAELKENALALGCNAVIGVDFDYLTMEPQTASPGGGTVYEPYVICVTANGNAVVIEKE